MVVVDQLEEAFTHCDEPARTALLDALADLATDPGTAVAVVVTLRADFYPRLAEHARLADLASAHHFLVPPMDEVGLAEAIERPARAAGLSLEDGLTETMLGDVAARPGALPLLAHCLLELWQRREGGKLTLAAYRDVGGVDGALAQRAEAVYAELPAAQQAVARRVLLRLTEPSEHHDARRRVAFDELPSGPDEHDAVEAVVDRLAAARLVTVGGPPTEARWVEMAHEALIRAWPRLQGWVDEDRAGLQVHRRLTAAVAEWERLGRDDGACYRGAQLAEAAAWAERHPHELNRDERAFLEASSALEEGERRRRLRRLRWTAVSLAVGLAVVAGMAAVALIARDEARQQQRLAQSRQLAADAVAELALQPTAGLEQAVAAVELAATREAVAALRQALITPHPRLGLAHQGGDVAVDRAGDRVAVVGDAGVVVHRLDDGAPVAELDGPDGELADVELSADGRRLLTATRADGVDLWDVDAATHRHGLTDEPTISAAWLPDGQRVAATTPQESGVTVWDADSGEVERVLPTPGPVRLVRAGPQGRWLLAWSAVDPEVFVLDVDTGDVAAVLDGHDPVAVEADLSPDGRTAVTTGFDDRARLWSLPDGEELAVLDGFGGDVWIGRFDAAGERVVLGDGVGTVRIADATDGTTLVERAGHDDTVVDADFGPDGRTLATVARDGTARVWDVDGGRERAVLPLDGAAELDVGRSQVVVAGDAGVVTNAATVQAWELPAGPEARLGAHDGFVSALEVAPDGTRVASGAFDGSIRVWDLDAAVETARARTDGRVVRTVSFDAAGERLATALPAQSAAADTPAPPTIWDAASLERRTTLQVPAPAAPPCPQVCQTTRARYGPDGAVVTSGQQGVVRRWDADTGEQLDELEPVDATIHDLALDPAGAHAAGATDAGTVVWDVDAREVVAELPVAGVGAAFRPDGAALAVAGQDGVVSLWDVDAARRTGELRHASTVDDVAWSPDGAFLLTATGDGAHLWDAASLQRIRTISGQGAVGRAAFADASRLVLGGADGAVTVHRCGVCGPVDELLEAARARLEG